MTKNTQLLSPSIQVPKKKETLFHLQGLRAIAALMVVFLHALHAADVYAGGTQLNHFLSLAGFGAVGVDIFFVMSGFIMVYVSIGQFQKPGASTSFLLKRTIRVAPIYWLFTGLYVSLLLFVPSAFNADKLDIVHTFKSYLFIPSTNQFTGTNYPVLTPGWTLQFEFYFYLIFAVCLFFPRRYFLLIASTVLGGGVLLGSLNDFQPGTVLGLITDPLLLEFLLGCFIGAIFVQGKKLSTTQTKFLFFLGFVLLLATLGLETPENSETRGGFLRFFIWGIPAALLVAGAIFHERAKAIKVPALVTALGNSSYSLYLSHCFILPVVGKIWFKFGVHSVLPAELFLVVAMTSSLAFGHIVHHMIEKPMTRMLRTIVLPFSKR